MKQIIKRGSFFTLMFMLLGCLSIQAANDDLITKQITIKLDEAGTLPNKIGSSKKYLITNLKIIGEINGTDWGMIRAMAGFHGNLSVLDLSEAKIVMGGNSYYFSDGDSYYTSTDKIGAYAFSYCRVLTSLTLPSNLTSIDHNAFDGCTGLTSLNLPDGITSIGSRAFSGCSGLTSLNLPSSLTTIGESAFNGCTGLTSLNLPSSITSIGRDAFYNCSGLKEVRFCINDNLDTYLTKGHPYIRVNCGIKYYINDKEITSIKIPSNVTTLGHNVFQGCSGLTSISLPASITKIGEDAFQNCSGLTSIYVYAEKIPGIGSNAFEGCDAKKCTVYVPKGTYDDYWLSEFGYFENIVEFEATGIDKTTTSTDVEEVSRYSVNGQRLVGPTKGLNIVKYSDGSVKKVVVE